MIVLDTNVLSALMKDVPDREVARWLDRQPRTSVWTTSVTIFEIRFGLQVMPLGKRRARLMQSFELIVSDRIEQRIAPLDATAVQLAADLMAMRHQEGRAVDFRDTMIAGIVLASKATLATRNVTHFGDLSVPVVNPWAAA